MLGVGKEASALKAERGWGVGGQQDPGCEKWVLAGEHVGQQRILVLLHAGWEAVGGFRADVTRLKM